MKTPDEWHDMRGCGWVCVHTRVSVRVCASMSAKHCLFRIVNKCYMFGKLHVLWLNGGKGASQRISL